MMGGDINRNM